MGDGLRDLSVDSKIEPFSLKNSILPINDWALVKNGNLIPNLSGDKSTLHFKIPLMLRSIGAWFERDREDKEYRVIPLGIFAGIN